LELRSQWARSRFSTDAHIHNLGYGFAILDVNDSYDLDIQGEEQTHSDFTARNNRSGLETYIHVTDRRVRLRCYAFLG
jgi:hypothetical protein